MRAMEEPLGYSNSQTWQAWFESYQVLWNNTSLIFVASVGVSLAVVVVSWVMGRAGSLRRSPRTQGGKDNSPKEGTEEEDSEKNEDKFDQEKKDVDRVIKYAQHLPGELKKAHQRSLEKTIETDMSEDQRRAEREAQSQQLAAIFKLMQEQEEKFGETTMDEIKDQMKLYCG